MTARRERVTIWSAQWQRYWRPNACGNTDDVREAGVWPRAEAERITKHFGPEKKIELRPDPARAKKE